MTTVVCMREASARGGQVFPTQGPHHVSDALACDHSQEHDPESNGNNPTVVCLIHPCNLLDPICSDNLYSHAIQSMHNYPGPYVP